MNHDRFKNGAMSATTWLSVLAAGAFLVLSGLVMAATDKTENETQSIGQKLNHANSEVKAERAAATTPVKDSWTTAKTKIALFGDDRVRGTQVNVETTKGVVMLRGTVDSDGAKKAAEEIVTDTEHVKGVKNELQVVAPINREAAEDKDELITTRVKEQLKRDASLRNAGIGVQTNAGVVSLTGKVRNIMVSGLASEVAWSTPGVHSVKNDLSLKDNKVSGL
jgi:hyperosmotically inducible protein